MRMQVILDSSFVRPGSAPIRGGKKGEFRNWTNVGLAAMFANESFSQNRRGQKRFIRLC